MVGECPDDEFRRRFTGGTSSRPISISSKLTSFRVFSSKDGRWTASWRVGDFHGSRWIHSKPMFVEPGGLQEFLQVFHTQLTVAQNFAQQSRSDRLTRVRRHDSTPSVFVAEKMMAPFDSNK